ncbi:hypothetical protein BGZ96_003548, partial [Linnemannia gamsii]
MTPNLVVLSLRANEAQVTKTLFALVINLPFLKNLSLDAPNLLPDFDIEYMFLLFERLDELELEGIWPSRIPAVGELPIFDTP